MATPAVSSVTARPRRGFFQRVLRTLARDGIRCLVGGTYAYETYTGIRRATKDLDLFILADDWSRVVDVLDREGVETELTFPHWLGKAIRGRHYVDLLFSSGNGMCRVDEDWFTHATRARFWGVDAAVCPVEELIWTKCFVQERERFDGADVLHLLRAQASKLDWDRLLLRFDGTWEVLLAHLVLFGFVYPTERALVPAHVMQSLIARLNGLDTWETDRVCRGTLLSREQFLVDVSEFGYRDARLAPAGTLTPDLLVPWTAEIPLARRATLSPRRRQRRLVSAYNRPPTAR